MRKADITGRKHCLLQPEDPAGESWGPNWRLCSCGSRLITGLDSIVCVDSGKDIAQIGASGRPRPMVSVTVGDVYRWFNTGGGV